MDVNVANSLTGNACYPVRVPPSYFFGDFVFHSFPIRILEILGVGTETQGLEFPIPLPELFYQYWVFNTHVRVNMRLPRRKMNRTEKTQ